MIWPVVKYFKVREIVKFIPCGAVEFIMTLGEFFCNYRNKWGGFTKIQVL